MKAEILEIITQHKFDHISSEQAVSELLDLFAVCALHEQCTHHRRSVKMSNLQILLKIPIVRG